MARNFGRTQTLLLALAVVALATTANAQTIITGTANGPNQAIGSQDDGRHDTWNNASNWSGGIPSGAVDAVVGAGITAQVWNDSTPTYTGNLTLDTGSTLQLGWVNPQRPGNLNALGGGSITLNDGSQLRLRMSQPNPIFLPAFSMAGDASIDLSPSTSAHHTRREFDGVIDGPGTLTVIGNNNNTAYFDTANPDWSGGFVADAVDGWRVEANVSGAFGTGDVTLNARGAGDRGASLIIDATDAIDDFATLNLNGPRDQRVASKLILNADDTVGAFFLDGADLGVGTFDAGSGLFDSIGNPLITGGGTLTVTGITQRPSGEVVPEPASIAIWSLIGLSLAAFGYRLKRRQ